MSKFLLITGIIAVLTISGKQGFAQTKSADAAIFRTILYTAGKDINRALHMADSVYRVSNEPVERMKSLMLLADLNLAIGKKGVAMDHAFQAEQIAIENESFEWQARIYGFIATHYRSIGLHSLGKKYLKKGLEAIAREKRSHIVNQYKGLAYQELALCEMELADYEKAVKLLVMAEPFLKKIRTKEIRLYQLACNYAQLGRAHMHLKNTASAIGNFNSALNLLSEIENEAAVVKGYVYEGMGRTYLEKGELPKSVALLEKALEIAIRSDNLDLQVEVYGDLAIYYIENNDKRNYKKYRKLYLDHLEVSTRVNKRSLEIVVNRLQ